MATTNFDDLIMGFEWLNAAESSGSEAVVYVSRETGAVVWSGDGAEDDVPDDIDDEALYAQIPLKTDLDLGRELVRKFVRHRMPDAYDAVMEIFRSSGAYSRFKSYLQRAGRLDEWHDFENSSVEMALFAWCEENGITLDRLPDAGAVGR